MLHHEQNIWRMGGLKNRLPITFLTFAVGALALIGCPPFSGFFSKDAILLLAWRENGLIFAVGLFTAFLTAFYVTRLLVVAFFGNARGDAARSSHEAPPVMAGPLILLAVPSILAGFSFFAEAFLRLPEETERNIIVPGLALTALILGASIAVIYYRNRSQEPFDVPLLRRAFYIDDFYRWLIDRTQENLARLCAFIDRWVIDAGAVGGAGNASWGAGALLRFLQVGNLQAYAFLFGLGIVALIYFTVIR
jgi:NADH-quinone oxidoreductase subunit L